MIKKPTVIFLMDMFAYTLMLYFSIISSKKKEGKKKNPKPEASIIYQSRILRLLFVLATHEH